MILRNCLLALLTLSSCLAADSPPQSPSKTQPVTGRYVRVDLKGNPLHLAEIEVYSGGKNVALHQEARLSSTGYEGVASRVVDGNRSGGFPDGSVCHSGGNTAEWLEIDLGKAYEIDAVLLFNRTDYGTADRLVGAQVSIGDENKKQLWCAAIDDSEESYEFKLNDRIAPYLKKESHLLFVKEFAMPQPGMLSENPQNAGVLFTALDIQSQPVGLNLCFPGTSQTERVTLPIQPSPLLFKRAVVVIDYQASESAADLKLEFRLRLSSTDQLISVRHTTGQKRAILEIPSRLSDSLLSALEVLLEPEAGAEASVTIQAISLYKRVGKFVDSPLLDADEILKQPPPIKATVENVNGAMAILVDGKPISGFGWSHIAPRYVPDPELAEMVGNPGLTVHRIGFHLGTGTYKNTKDMYPDTWLAPGVFDFSYIDGQISRVLKVNPAAKIILLVAADGTDWWGAVYPESRGDNPRYPDYLSADWKRESRQALRQAIAHFQKGAFAGNIIGYELFNGESLDVNFELAQDTPKAISRFQDFLRRKYASDLSRLRQSWNHPAVTFENAKPLRFGDVPKDSPAFKAYDILLRPTLHQQLIDTREFKGHVYEQVAIDFCKNVKEATHRRVLTGGRMGDLLYSGWGFGKPGEAGSGVGWADNVGDNNLCVGFPIDKLITDPNIDFWDQWEPYPGRGLGDFASGAQVNPARGLQIAGKLLVLQDDCRNHLGPDRGYGGEDTPNLSSAIAKQRRILVNALTMGLSPYLWQMNYHFNDPGLMQLWAQMDVIMQKSLQLPRENHAPVAYVVDRGYSAYLGPDVKKINPTRGFSLIDNPRYYWARSGVPYDVIFLDQINEKMDYQVYVFYNTFCMTRKTVEELKKVLRQKNRVGIFVWADGLFDGRGEVGVKTLNDLTGMHITMDERSSTWEFVADKTFARKFNLQGSEQMGLLRTQEDAACPGFQYSPSFYVDDPDVLPISVHKTSGQVVIASKEAKDYTSIYCASPYVVPEVMNYALERANVFRYCDSDEITYVNDCFLGFHTKEERKLIFRLPSASSLYEVFRGIELGEAESHEFQVEKNETYLFFRGTRKQWESLSFVQNKNFQGTKTAGDREIVCISDQASYSPSSTIEQYSGEKDKLLRGGGNSGWTIHTENEQSPYVIIDLGKAATVTGFNIINRKDDCQERAATLTAWAVSEQADWRQIWQAAETSPGWDVKLENPITTRYLKIGLREKTLLNLYSISVYGNFEEH